MINDCFAYAFTFAASSQTIEQPWNASRGDQRVDGRIGYSLNEHRRNPRNGMKQVRTWPSGSRMRMHRRQCQASDTPFELPEFGRLQHHVLDALPLPCVGDVYQPVPRLNDRRIGILPRGILQNTGSTPLLAIIGDRDIQW